LATLVKAAVKSGKSMRWLEGYLTECLSQLPEEALESLAASPFDGGVPAEGSPTKGNNLQKMDRKKITAMRDSCFDRYETCLRNLSSSSRQLHLLLQGVLLGYESGVNDPSRERICQSLRKMGEVILPEESSENQFLLVGRGLDYLADKGLVGASPLGSPADCGKIAREVERIASKIAETMPYLLAICGDGAEERLIREHALGFAVHAEGVSHHLHDLRKIDAERGVK